MKISWVKTVTSERWCCRSQAWTGLFPWSPRLLPLPSSWPSLGQVRGAVWDKAWLRQERWSEGEARSEWQLKQTTFGSHCRPLKRLFWLRCTAIQPRILSLLGLLSIIMKENGWKCRDSEREFMTLSRWETRAACGRQAMGRDASEQEQVHLLVRGHFSPMHQT